MTTADHRDPDTLRSLYHDQGLTQTEIAEELDVDGSVISRAFNKHDIEVVYNRSRRKDKHKDAGTLRELYHEERLTQDEIGKKFGVSGTTIRRWMNDLGVKTGRPRKEDILGEIQRLAENEIPPTQREYRDTADYSLNAAKNRFGSWAEAVEAAGFEPFEERPSGAGEENPAWRGGCEKYYGPNWQAQRTKAVIRDQARCQDCRMTESESLDWFGYRLDVHHIEPIKSFKTDGEIDFNRANETQNLVSLCRSCHQERESSSN